jgi:methylmalonyl-CoA mutase N-terminal domain/subunit
MKEKYGAKDPRSWMLRFHTQTAGCSLTAQQPENNIVRTAFQALSAVLGGTQSLHTNSMDETLALPTEQAVQIALRTQQLIACESGVTNVIDPLAGSYFLEALTDRMEEQAEEYFRRIEELGGVLEAIDAGFFQREIADAAYRYQREIERGDRVVVGMNRFQNADEAISIDLLKIDPTVEKKQQEKLAKLRASRAASEVEAGIAALRQGAEGDTNLMPLIISCARAYCTEGEIIGVLREVFGEYRETALF